MPIIFHKCLIFRSTGQFRTHEVLQIMKGLIKHDTCTGVNVNFQIDTHAFVCMRFTAQYCTSALEREEMRIMYHLRTRT